MAEYIECRNCDSNDCRGCNTYLLSTMLNEGKFDCLMDDHHGINRFIDVAPVVHGRWEIKTDDYDCEYAKCSACGEEFYDANEDTIDITFNYCPNCGAHMKDGEG